MLKRIGVEHSGKEIFSFHDHSSDEKLRAIVSNLKNINDTINFVSDAGSPVISDPAYKLVKECIKEGIQIESFSGITSVIHSLELSGFPSTPFVFLGFFPRDKSDKEKVVKKIKLFSMTSVFFESPKRIIKTLEYLSEKIPNESVCICRELTKKFETIHRFKLNELNKFKNKITQKGEFVLVIDKIKESDDIRIIDGDIIEIANELVSNCINKKNLSKLLAKILNKNPKEIYKSLI